jgi:hypothetical protein
MKIQKRTNDNISKTNYRQGENTGTTLFGFVSSILAVPFVLMILVFTYSASNPEHSVLIIFNAYGEWMLEVIVFTVTGVIVVIGAVINIKKLRETKQ